MKRFLSIILAAFALSVALQANLCALDFQLTDGSKITGEIQEKVEFQTPFGTLAIDGAVIKSIAFGEKTNITFADGQTLTGAVKNAVLKVKWKYGVMDLDLKRIKSIGAETAGAAGGTSSGGSEQSPAPANMILVGGGSFKMGSQNGNSEEKPVHDVQVSGFYLGRYELTQKEWMEIIGKNPSNNKGDNLPVENISWYDIIEYCNRRSLKEGLKPFYFYGTRGTDPAAWPSDWKSTVHDRLSCDWTANGYRLPTEAEWEYAARGGKSGKGYQYSGSNDIGFIGWYYNNASSKTHPVGEREPNELGFYDMSGNVWEWCWDWYGPYLGDSQTDPQGAGPGSYRIHRSGSYGHDASYARSTRRSSGEPLYRSASIGFRVLRPAPR